MNNEGSQAPPSITFAIFLIGLGLAAAIFAQQIRSVGLGDTHDPGPKTFPVALGICLVLGGAIELVTWFRNRPKSGSTRSATASSGALSVLVSDAGNLNVIILLLALVAYIPAMSILGFTVATFVFAAGLMIRLGTKIWLASCISAVMVLVINLLFVKLFKVVLPAGNLGLPF